MQRSNPSLTRLSTQALLTDLDRGGEAAFHELLRRHFRWLERVIRGRLGQELRRHAETADFLQDVYLQVIRYRSHFKVSTKLQFRALLARVVINLLTDRGRFARAGKRDFRREESPKRGTGWCLHLLDPAVGGPGTHASRNEARERLRAALDRLEPADRDILVQRDLESRSFADIGRSLGITRQGAQRRYDSALGRLALAVQQARTEP